MDEQELDRLIKAWDAYYTSPKGAEREKHWWALRKVIEFTSSEPESIWQFVTAAYRQNLCDEAIGSLAAGPLESLIAFHGEGYIDRIEKLASEDAEFKDLLTGVFRNNATSEVWARIQHIRKDVL
jgi:hypothetical protein